MKIQVKFAVIFLMIVSLTMAASTAHAGGPIEKLGRGIENVVLSPKEYLNTWEHVSETRSPIISSVMTAFYGTVFTLTRIVVGTYEIVTFPIPLPQQYEPVMNPATP